MAKKSKNTKAKSQHTVSPSGKRNTPSSDQDNPGAVSTWIIWIFLGISALIFLQTRIKLLAIPLERDEGSFAYIGHWLLRGRELYTDMLDSKLPGLYAYYGFFTSVFGLNSTGVHIGLLVANVVSAICFYLLVKAMYNQLVAGIATVFFLFLVISSNVVGFASHATQLLTPFVIGGSLLFWRGIQSGKWILFFLAGLMIGIAFSIKQQAAIYGIILAALWWPARLIWYKKEKMRLPIKEWLALGVGGFIPLALIVGYYALAGRIDEFYNWTVTQPFRLAGSFAVPRYQLFLNILPKVLQNFQGIWILAGAGLIFVFMSNFKKEAPWFGSIFALGGLLSVMIGAAYYQHYFVLAMPGIALLAAVSLNWISRKTGKYGYIISLSIAIVLMMISMKGRKDYFFNPDFAKIHFETYNNNMFPELERIGQELARRVPEGQRIGIMGSEPELLVAAGRESCSKYLMIYALLSDPELSPPMQEDYLREMQACAPEYIVWNLNSASWTRGYEQLKFFKELKQWLDQNYELTGMAESRDDKPGILVWDEGLRTHQPTSNFRIFVMKRK